MIRSALFLPILFCLASCGDSNEPASNKPDSVAIEASQLVPKADESGKSEPSLTGIESFVVDTVTQEEYQEALTVYSNSFMEDTALFLKQNGVTTIQLENKKSITFTDYQNPNDESDVVRYNYRGHLSNRLYYLGMTVWEDYFGLLVQQNGQVDTIYYSPIMSRDDDKFCSVYTEYASIGDFGFFCYEYKNTAFVKRARVEFHDGTLIGNLIWSNSDVIYCQTYTETDLAEGRKRFTYLRFKLK